MHITPISPLREALSYYNCRVNGGLPSDLSRKFSLISSAKREQLDSLLAPIITLQRILDRELDYDASLLGRFFKAFEGIPEVGVGRNPASLLYAQACLRPYEGIDQIASGLKSRSLEKVHLDFMYELALSGTKVFQDKSDLADLLDLLSSLPISNNARWRVIDVYQHINEYIDDCAELLKPAISIITANADLCSGILKDFERHFSNFEHVIAYTRKRSEINNIAWANPSEITITPGLFLFYKSQTIVNVDEKNTAYAHMFIGALINEFSSLTNLKMTPAQAPDVLKAMGDETRYNILRYIKNNDPYGQEIAKQFNMTPNLLSHHMSKLQAQGLVNTRMEGNRVYYSINQDNILLLLDQVREELLGESGS